MNTIEQIKDIVNKQKIKYSDIKVKLWINRYKKFKLISDLNRVRVNCYPLILGAIKSFVKKDKSVNDKNKVFSNEELVGEAIIVLDNCIKLFDMRRDISFVTYYWSALMRHFIRYNKKYNLLVHKTKKESYIHIDNFFILKDGYSEDDIKEYKRNSDFKNVSTEINFDSLYIKQLKEFLHFELEDLEFKVLVYLLRGFTASKIKKILKIPETKFRKINNKIKSNILKES